MSIESRTIEGHIVILGWSDRVKRIIRELRDENNFSQEAKLPILVVAESEDLVETSEFEKVYFVYGAINDSAVLRRANIDKAEVVLIPANLPESVHFDGNTVFAMFAALSVNPKVRVCVEVASADNGRALQEICAKQLIEGAVEIVSFESVSERLLAQAAVNSGVTKVYEHLLSFSDTNEIYVVDVPAGWINRTFRELSQLVFNGEVILIGFEHNSELVINPRDRDYRFEPGDRGWFIAYNKEAVLEVLAQNPDRSE